MKTGWFILFFCIFVFEGKSLPGGSPDRCVVRGRVVDETGRPVQAADVLVVASSYLKSRSPFQFFETSPIDEAGKFVATIPLKINGDKILVFIDPPQDPTAVSLFSPPFDEPLKGCRSAPRFLELPIPKSGVIDLGDVRPQNAFQTMSFTFRDFQNLTRENILECWVDVYCERGSRVVSSGISQRDRESAFDEKEHCLRLSLPSGKWRVRIYPFGKKSGRFEERKFSIVSP